VPSLKVDPLRGLPVEHTPEVALAETLRAWVKESVDDHREGRVASACLLVHQVERDPQTGILHGAEVATERRLSHRPQEGELTLPAATALNRVEADRAARLGGRSG
jgi:hypothetical protein